MNPYQTPSWSGLGPPQLSEAARTFEQLDHFRGAKYADGTNPKYALASTVYTNTSKHIRDELGIPEVDDDESVDGQNTRAWRDILSKVADICQSFDLDTEDPELLAEISWYIGQIPELQNKPRPAAAYTRWFVKYRKEIIERSNRRKDRENKKLRQQLHESTSSQQHFR